MSTRVRDISEFALIDRLLAALPDDVRGGNEVDGQQDDCAWWTPAPGHRVLVTSDALVEGVHFRLDWTDWFSLGHKSLAVNLSDLASMGCTPRLAVVTLCLTGDELITDLEELYRGMGALAQAYGIAIVGGDIVSTPGPITISVTAFGEQPTNTPPMRRSAAAVGDILMVSGTLGASAAGLRLLQENRGATATTAGLLISAHNRPQPRVSLGLALHKIGVHCGMDLSDGLSGDLPKILTASNVGADIYVDNLPVLPAVHALFPHDWRSLALHGGEDYELLIAVAPSLHSEVLTKARDIGATMTVIGEVTAEPGINWISDQPLSDTPTDHAWDHFQDG